MFDLKQLAGRLTCPDDGRVLRSEDYEFGCDCCGRVFPIRQRQMIDLLPSAPIAPVGDMNPGYCRAYEEEFRRPLLPDARALPWGAPEVQPAAWRRKRQRQVEAVLPRLSCAQDTSELLLCDVSAGAGLYTLSYAPHFKGVLHCDLSPTSLAYALAKANRRNLDNVVFLRIDYLRPPFRRTLDRVLCMDSLIRGPIHERLLLRSVCGMLNSTGRAVVDFHNWWHNPLRRLGLLPQNFTSNFSYSKGQADHLLASVGIRATSCFRFLQELDTEADGYISPGRFFLPASRFVYTLAPPLC